jgi:hypothetical protein
LKGAAEYEILTDAQGPAVEGMRVQLVAHSIVILFIIIGNIGFFAIRRSKNKSV